MAENLKPAYRKVVRAPDTNRLEVHFFDAVTHKRIFSLKGYTLVSQDSPTIPSLETQSTGSTTPLPTTTTPQSNLNNRGNDNILTSANAVKPTGNLMQNPEFLAWVASSGVIERVMDTGLVKAAVAMGIVPDLSENSAVAVATDIVEQAKGALSSALDFLAPSTPAADATEEISAGVTTQTSARGQGAVLNPSEVDISKIDPRMLSVLNEAASRSNYIVQIAGPASGSRTTPALSGSNHGLRNNQSNALDIQLIDPVTGEALPNIQNAEAYRAYEQFAQIARLVQMRDYPELNDSMRWGGYFASGNTWADMMHFDLNRDNVASTSGGMGGGSWETGASSALLARLGPNAESRGMEGMVPKDLKAYPILGQEPTKEEIKIQNLENAAVEDAGVVIDANIKGMKRAVVPPNFPTEPSAVDAIIINNVKQRMSGILPDVDGTVASLQQEPELASFILSRTSEPALVGTNAGPTMEAAEKLPPLTPTVVQVQDEPVPNTIITNDLTPVEVEMLIKAMATETDWTISSDEQKELMTKAGVDVVLNRVVSTSSMFPNTIEDVLNAPKAFSAITAAGGINNISTDTEEYALAEAIILPYLEARRAGEPNIVGDAVNFGNPYAADPRNREWIMGLNGPTFGEGQKIHRYGSDVPASAAQFDFITEEFYEPSDPELVKGTLKPAPKQTYEEYRTLNVLNKLDTKALIAPVVDTPIPLSKKPSIVTEKTTTKLAGIGGVQDTRQSTTKAKSTSTGFVTKPKSRTVTTPTAQPTPTPKVPLTKLPTKSKDGDDTVYTPTKKAPTTSGFVGKPRKAVPKKTKTKVTAPKKTKSPPRKATTNNIF